MPRPIGTMLTLTILLLAAACSAPAGYAPPPEYPPDGAAVSEGY